MAKSKEKNSSINKRAWFRSFFEKNPDELRSNSSASARDLWNAEHPDAPWDKDVQASFASAKTALRKEQGIEMRGTGRKKKRKTTTVAPEAPKVTKRRPVAVNALEEIEGQIVRCLMLATQHNNEETLNGVLKHLKMAHRSVVKELVTPGNE